jgi:DNA mismatch repair protein MutS
LLNVLDQTITSMGGRMLKDWLLKPLTDKQLIEQRYDLVEYFAQNEGLKGSMREKLKEVPDVERLISRLSIGLGNARDLINLKLAALAILEIKKNALGINLELSQHVGNKISKRLKEIAELIDENIVEEPPLDVRQGGMIKDGVSKNLDELRSKIRNSKDWVLELESDERKKTGINSLKVRFNKVFGFYIEVSKPNLNLVPDHFQRKQTLVSSERFITPELKKHEEIILGAEEKINDLEYLFFQKILEKVLLQSGDMLDAAEAIASLDCILNFAYIAKQSNYIRPKLVYGSELKIKNGRHPVVEKLLEDGQFVPNSINIGGIESQLHLITGPNMAGKSVLIRQVALLVLMSQIGCFIPADNAEISIVDRIFVRSGASDVITSGLSTFMVEMVETAYILNHATKNSLIVMDEIGRGTSTYDGISIAWAITEYLVKHFKTPPKTLFATHYHELQKLESQYPKKIKNYSMAVAEHEEQPVFLYSLVEGGASASFGVAVAKLAGVPNEVISKASEKLIELESEKITDVEKEILLNRFEPREEDIIDRLILKELENLDIHQMTPLDALNKLAEIKGKIKLLTSEHGRIVEIN